PPTLLNLTKDTTMADDMLQRLHDQNPLYERILKDSLAKNSKWHSVFQIKQGYVAEHKKLSSSPREKQFVVELCTDEPDLLRMEYQSRFVNSKTRISYVQFDGRKELPIVCCYCTCSSESRTIGWCSQSAATLWYLGYERYLTS
ncbi:unnamed protein product, partial [Didymodactylos carnosus]